MNGKKWGAVLIAVGIFFLGQSFAVVWWASSVNTRLGMMEQMQTEIRKAIEDGMKDRYTGDDADRDLERQRVIDRGQDERVNKLHTQK